MKNSLPVAFFGWVALVFVASFIPWGAVNAASLNPFGGSLTNPLGGFPFGGTPFTNLSINVTAWQSSLKMLGMSLPNWLVVVAATAVAVFAYLRATGSASVSRGVCIAIIVYGIVHAALFAMVIASNGSIGLGLLLTLAALFGMLFSLPKVAQNNQDAIVN
jgi:hypothetical protein